MGLPRRQCPFCKRSTPVRVNGALREHKYLQGLPEKCPASGLSVVDAEALKAKHDAGAGR
jgi:hypothetical protein